MKKIFFVFLAMVLLMSACAGTGEGGSITGDWKLTAYGSSDAPQAAVPDMEAIVTFDRQGQVSGNLGCNSFGGGYKVKGEQVTFDEIAMTLMACAGAQMRQEEAAFKVMAGSVEYKIEGSTLTLTKEGQVLLFEAVEGN